MLHPLRQTILIVSASFLTFRYCFAINWLIIHNGSILQKLRHPPSHRYKLSSLTQGDLPSIHPLLLITDHASQVTKVTLNLDTNFQGYLQAWGSVSLYLIILNIKVLDNKGPYVAPEEFP